MALSAITLIEHHVVQLERQQRKALPDCTCFRVSQTETYSVSCVAHLSVQHARRIAACVCTTLQELRQGLVWRAIWTTCLSRSYGLRRDVLTFMARHREITPREARRTKAWQHLGLRAGQWLLLCADCLSLNLMWKQKQTDDMSVSSSAQRSRRGRRGVASVGVLSSA